jgi:hypothetical protein
MKQHSLKQAWHEERIPWPVAFTAASIFFLISCTRPASLCCEEYVHIHISDCVESVYEVSFVPNNTTSEIFLHTSGAVGW